MLSYAVMSKYEELVNCVREAAENANCGSIAHAPPILKAFAFGAVTKFECFLLLKDWKWRPGSNDRVQILLHVKESLSADAGDPVVIDSVVVSTYFVIEDGVGKPLHTVHFDYGPPLDLHPVFHAQLTDSPVNAPSHIADELELNLHHTNTGLACFKNARIPTSDMTLISVLLCLGADHIGGQRFQELRKKLRSIEESMPRPNFDSLRASLAASSLNFRSSHWFAHMPSPPSDAIN